MKRHIYVFPKYIKKINKEDEISILILKFFKDQQIIKDTPFIFSITDALQKIFIPFSKINTYCLVTGRVRYTIKKTQTSRHIFYEYCSDGNIPGFFFSS